MESNNDFRNLHLNAKALPAPHTYNAKLNRLKQFQSNACQNQVYNFRFGNRSNFSPHFSLLCVCVCAFLKRTHLESKATVATMEETART